MKFSLAIQCLYIKVGWLFAYIDRKDCSTKYSSFKLLYNQTPVYSIDIKHNLLNLENRDIHGPFDMKMFKFVWSLQSLPDMRCLK